MAAQFADRLEAGKPYPLGATWDGLGVNFAIFSANAESVELCLFDSGGKHQIARYPMPERTNEVWHGYLPHASPGLLYGYRVAGPYAPAEGHRFNPAKLLIDPYSRALSGSVRWVDSLFGYRTNSSRADLSIDHRDSANAMPKSVVIDDQFSWEGDRRPEIPWDETVIYEAHVRGMTKLFEQVRPPQSGTFAGLSHPDVISHLRRLGVTTIELMPVHAFLQDRMLLSKGLRNYWGYNTLSFFSLEPRYLSDGSPREMREMVRRYHAAGLEVILDVVYNHTCEGSELGPTLCWRGLDNASYYRLAEDRRYTINDTGTGNTLNINHPRVLQMVMDSLRHWANAFHVDGFRFDLGLTLARELSGFDPGSGFLDAIGQDPVLSRLKLITEPWDIGPGGYHLGGFPPGFSEWNDRYRDSLRRYWRSDPGMRPEVAARLSGSGDLFDARQRQPAASINYLDSHDGMTLHDVVSYDAKHNEANGEENKDGSDDNSSTNYGAEGPTDDALINDYRERVKRSMLAALFGSLGTPMIVMGDEFGRTQQGNNNAYCQDGPISWLDWSLLATDRGKGLFAFASRLIALRKEYQTLRNAKYLGAAEVAPGIAEMSWWDERGVELAPSDWENHEGRVLVLRRAKLIGDRIEITALMLNADPNKLDFKLPGALAWRVLIDSGHPEVQPRDITEETYAIEGRGAALIVAYLDAQK
jgi:glycogen operon protein